MTFSHRVRGVQQPVGNTMVMSGNGIVRVQGQGGLGRGGGSGAVMGSSNGGYTSVGMNWGIRAAA